MISIDRSRAGINRYAFLDPYTLEELRREYTRADVWGRIRMLEKHKQQHFHIPFEIAALAVEDQHVEIREWIARYGQDLDYREFVRIGEKWVRDPFHPEQNLQTRIRTDLDPFVRACACENDTIVSYWGDFENIFSELTHIECLALVRNPVVSTQLIEKIFDLSNTEVSIGLEERRELALAYLTNKENIEREARTR